MSLLRPTLDKATVAAAPDTVTVETSATQILAASNGRLQAIIRNTSDTDSLFLGYSDTITTANAPIKLAAGDAWVEDVSVTAIFGVVSSGTVAAAHQELT